MTPLFSYGLHIINAGSPIGYQYATFEIRTDHDGTIERYQWQSGGSKAKLWRVDSHDGKTLLAKDDAVANAMAALLSLAHAERQCLLSYREFRILVDGWVEGKGGIT